MDKDLKIKPNPDVEWVAMLDGKAIARGPDPNKVRKEAESICGPRRFSLLKVPKKGAVEVL